MATKPTLKVAAAPVAKSADCERRFEVYPDRAGKYRWRRVADNNGKIVGGSQESFVHERSAVRSAVREASFYLPGAAAVVVLEDTPADS
jgi:uncharacterized protein YegP (UPF0339 family)